MPSKRLQQILLISALLTTTCLLLRPYLLIPPSSLSANDAASNAVLPHPHHHDYLPEAEAEALCAQHDLRPWRERTQGRKIYDLIPFSTELDWLEIRMHELDSQVDYFVIVESTETFTGQPKPLHFANHYANFSRFAPKILYHALDLAPLRHNSTWEREAYTRNALFTAIFPSLLGAARPNRDDILLVSDADEIPRPETLTLLRNCITPPRVTLRSRFYYYSFQWHHVGGDWHHPQATVYAGLERTILPEDLRMQSAGNPTGLDLGNASWHCSSCFSRVAELVQKISGFSHTEYNRPEFVEPREIVRRVRHGLDLFDREGQDYEKVAHVTDVPEYLKLNARRFAFLLDRDPENANFEDYVV